MKKLAILFLVLLMPATAQAVDWCSNNAPKYEPIAKRYKKGLFFEVYKCAQESSYILGTMHSDDPKLIEMLDYVFPKLVYSKTANFEIRFSPEVSRTILEGMYISPDSIETLQSLIGTQLYSSFSKIMARVKPEMMEDNYYKMKPWAAAVMLQEPPRVADGLALDLKLQAFAEKRGMTVNGLETPEEQLSVFNDVPVEKQVEFLRDTVEEYDIVESEGKLMFDTYVAQDLTKLHEMGEKAFERMRDKQFAQKLKIDLIDKRNRNMVKAMTPQIESGSAFVAIGALHLPGKNGVLALLEEKGYFINIVEDPDVNAGVIR